MAEDPDDHDAHVLLARLLGMPAAGRGAALEAACAGRPQLHARLAHLLALAGRQDGFLDRAALLEADAPPAGPQQAAGRIVGAYRLLRPLGAGGSAEVWLAERIQGGFHQQVAVKLIAHLPGASARRFAAERGILATLVHPGIARLYDGGVTEQGLGWMAMEYVEGQDLVAWCRAHQATLAQRLDLFLQVCDAVAYAHTRLVVHRDIKPANILVTADGQARLLDFGIAKLLDQAPAGDEDVGGATATVQLSPSYAAPEQLDGGLVGTATDVHALGVTLFELLAGRLPWSGEGSALATAVRRLAEAAPPLASRGGGADAPLPGRALRGDLDAIIARALRQEPSARYPDARAMADDIRRHLQHQPVQARSGARGYVARRYLRRHWRGLAAMTLVFAVLSAALVGMAWQARKARLEAQRAQAVQAFLVDLFRSNSSNQPDPVKARQTTARELLDLGAARIGQTMDDAPENKLALLRVFGDLYYDLGLTDASDRLRRQVLALSRRLHGQDSPEAINDLVTLARVNNAVSARAEFDGLLAHGLAVLDGRGDTHSFLRGRLLATAAAVHNSSDPPRALAEAAQAVAILERYPDSPELADAMRLLGMGRLYTGQAAAAVEPLRRAVALSVKTQGARGSRLSIYYFQLAQAESAAMQFPQAQADARRALEEADNGEQTAASDRVRAQTLAIEIQTRAEHLQQAMAWATSLKAELAALGPDSDGPAKAYAMTTISDAEVQAGDLHAALADAEEAVRIYRRYDPDGAHLAVAVGKRAQALVELGRTAQAQAALEELDGFSRRMHNRRLDEFLATWRIRLALAQGRVDQARTVLAALPPAQGEAREMALIQARRDLLQARVALAAGDPASAGRLADAVLAHVRGSDLAPYLRALSAESAWVAGLARLHGGDPRAAQALLAQALATSGALYLPQSPRIAQARQALADCERALDRPARAGSLLTQAAGRASPAAGLQAMTRPPAAAQHP